MRTTTYTAPDKRRGYTAAELVAILSEHPLGTVRVRPGWKGQPQVVIVDDPDEYGAEARRARREALGNPDDLDRVECGTEPHLPPTRSEPPEGFKAWIGEGVDAALQGSLDATADEEWLRGELVREGVDVGAVEDVARIVQRTDPVLRRMDVEQHRQLLVDAGVELGKLDEITRRYEQRLMIREQLRRGGTR